MILPSSPSIPKSLEPWHLEKKSEGRCFQRPPVDAFGNLQMELYFFFAPKFWTWKSDVAELIILVMWISSEQLNRKSSVAPTLPCFQFTCMTRFITDRMWETLDDRFQFCFWECISTLLFVKLGLNHWTYTLSFFSEDSRLVLLKIAPTWKVEVHHQTWIF